MLNINNNNNINNSNLNKIFTRRLSNDINHFVVNNHDLTSENNVLIKNQQIDFTNINTNNDPPIQGM
jgi:hypothetical protein